MRWGTRRSWTARAGLALILAAAALTAKAEGKSGVPLDIYRAQELAAKASDEVRAREAAVEAALRAVDAARANFFPKLSGGVSGAFLPQPPSGVKVPAGSLGTLPLYYPTGIVYLPMPATELNVGGYTKDSYFKGNLTFTQPIVAWGKIKAAVDLASLEARVASIGSAGASLDAARAANRAYYSALLSKESGAILEELQALAASILEDKKSAFSEGFTTKEEVLSSTADLAALETRLVQAREGEASALESLGLLTGLDSSTIELVSPFRAALPPLFETGLKDEAARVSTDVDIARVRLSEARRKLDLERGSSLFHPDLSFFASLEALGQDVPFSSSSWWTNTWSWDLSLGIAANVDLFDGGASAARKREAAANLEAARIGEVATEKGARLQTRRVIDAARGAEASLREKEARAAWAAEALRNARAKAADQAASRAELNASAIGEATARLDLLYARFALEESIADLERLAGRPIGAEEHR
ncbi:MAG: TolC family protein [Rectinemataceae bacterium]|jgi:outer membrane protein TolC